ncbi:MAG: DsbA family oxidoreductase [Myxococcales bacterium]|nr:DsbA family oxidoreductase [Myxococcales bacterium]MCB9735318.1 DsbA family oxidoreductase [Deltaproteobacteria bacterium]
MTEGAAPRLQVEVWSDVLCPWCYLGKRRLERALAALDPAERERVDVTWRSFQLDPHAPAVRDGDLDDLLAKKYGMTREQARAGHARLTALGAEDAIDYHFEKARPGNSFDAHRLLQHARARGRADAMKERLMRAYFTEGVAIGDREELVRLAADAGLDEADARGVLESDAYAADVRRDVADAAELGIHGVPTFVFDRRYGISGAQPVEVLLETLRRGLARATG